MASAIKCCMDFAFYSILFYLCASLTAYAYAGLCYNGQAVDQLNPAYVYVSISTNIVGWRASAEPEGPFLLMFTIYLLWLIISFYIIYCRTFYGLKLRRGIFVLTPIGSRASSWGIKHRAPAGS
jgi:hypothetical protein